MHYLMLITLTVLPGESSSDARTRTYDMLAGDSSFCGDGGGRFGSPLCDWFVLGGCWSGLLQETKLGEPYHAALEREFPQIASGAYYPADLAVTNKERLNDLWRQAGGTGDSPITRSSYEEYGYDDDALPVDQTLYDHFLKRHEGQSGTPPESTEGHVVDLDDDEIDASFIGRKWLIVVDYHS
jgi:hypothetical protein